MTAPNADAALANADRYSSYESGYCLKWVRTCWEVGSFYASAIDAWNGARHKHPGDRNPPDGAPCFYRGGSYGHIVIHRRHDSGRIRSTDCTYSGHVSDADLSWPETAWGDDYLGWTEDLNGVDLPVLPEPQPPGEEMPQYLRAKMTKILNLKPDAWTSIPWDDVAHGDQITDGETAIRIGGKMTTATLTVTVDGDDGPPNEVLRTRFLERSKKGDEWTTDETWPNVEHPTSSGKTYAADTRAQSVADGRRLVAQVCLPNGGKIASAEFNALLF